MPRLFLRHGRALVAAVALALTCLAAVTGLDSGIDRALGPLRAALSARPPSGRIVVVEIDGASIAAIDRWPWSRQHHATLIDRLREAGAASITFDVDLSSPSTAAGDAAMAAALRRADGLVALPTFAQRARSGGGTLIDTLPLPAFRSHVALASVTMQPDPDGIVRRAPLGTTTARQPRPSLSSIIAHRSGSSDAFFPIDFGIDPTRLPRLSFASVEKGRFDPAAVRGREVVIGSTAIELGDHYATPRWGVIPGVIIQALAAETLLAGVPTQGLGALMLLLAALLALPIILVRSGKVAALAGIAAPPMLLASAVWLSSTLHHVEPLGAALVLVIAAGMGRAGLQLARHLERERCVDVATGLPNRNGMMRDLGSAEGGLVLVALIGNYADLVALLGEGAGHDLVRRIADRLRLSGSATVYRLADAMLAIDLSQTDSDLGDRLLGLRAVLTQPVEIVGRRTDAAVHVGISDEGETSAERLSSAMRAAEAARAAGAFSRQASRDVNELERRLVLMGELDHAIASGQIEVHYQPKLALASDRITSVEALVRWRHPARGMVRPDLFIPLAEQTDRIAPLTLFVLRRVIDDLARWRAYGLDLTAAVNLSAMLIAEPGFSAALDDLLDHGSARTDRLIFEVTESATLADPDQAIANLSRFRDRGVAISMDDYGTGQSTLTYLRQLPLSELKIDRSFVQHAHSNRSDGLMVRSTIDLAHDLGIRVVAEGIEEEACLAFLREASCDYAQGYLIARPMTAEDLVTFVSRPRLAA